MPTLAQVITKINSDITANGNEEITGLVLNSVLLDIVAQINDLTGQLEDLNTDDVTSIVNAINSLKQELDDYINSQMGVLGGLSDPNEETPVGFDGRIGTIYIQNVAFASNITPLSYWIYTGINDIGWLNLTADDTFKMVIVDHYEDLPAQGQTNRIYFVQDDSNTYIWNVNIFPNDYVLVGGVINGEYVDDTTFNDEFGSPVVPDTGNLYLDTITGKYYRWDGNYFLPIDQDTGGTIPTLSEVLSEGNVADRDIEFDSNIHDGGIYQTFNTYKSGIFFYRDETLDIYSKRGSSQESFMRFDTTGLIVMGSSSLFGGLRGLFYFGANYDDNTYVQKKYVDDNFLPLPTEGTSGQVLTTDGAGDYAWEDVEADFSDLTNNVIPKKSPSGNDLVDSNIQDTAVGSEVSGRLDSNATVERSTQTTAATTYAIDLSDPSGHYDLTLTDNTSIGFSNMIGANQSTVITLVVGGNYSLLFPSWLKPMPNNDSYYSNSASDVNLITILIRNGGGTPAGMYSLTNIDIA